MSHDLSSKSYLNGQLLLAVPSLRDSYFARSVVFLAAHSDEDGSFGYILNRPLKQRVGDLMPDQDLGPLGELPVFMGGPVGADKLAFASLRWSRARKTLKVNTHLSVDDALHELSLGRQVRGFVGYSGWEGGQLERELEQRSWITTIPDQPLILTAEAGGLWGDLLRSMGPAFGLLANVPEDVSVN
jgi:putative transcriptional regulator